MRLQERQEADRQWEERLAGASARASTDLRRTAQQAADTEADLRKQLRTGGGFLTRPDNLISVGPSCTV